MGNVVFLDRDENTLFMNTDEFFNINTLSSLRSILEFQSFKTNSFMLGCYKFITHNTDDFNMIILGANNGDIVYDDTTYVEPDKMESDFKDKTYKKIKNITIIK